MDHATTLTEAGVHPTHTDHDYTPGTDQEPSYWTCGTCGHDTAYAAYRWVKQEGVQVLRGTGGKIATTAGRERCPNAA